MEERLLAIIDCEKKSKTEKLEAIKELLKDEKIVILNSKTLDLIDKTFDKESE